MAAPYVFASGAWRKVKAPYVFASGAWRKCTMWVFTQGAWRKVPAEETATYSVRTVDFNDLSQGAWGARPGDGSITPITPNIFGLTAIINDDGSTNVQNLEGSGINRNFRATVSYGGQSRTYDLIDGTNSSGDADIAAAHVLAGQAQRDGQPFTFTLTTTD